MRRCTIYVGILCAVFFAGVVRATAQSPYQVSASTLSDVEFTTTNYGPFGFDVAHLRPGFIVPRGSNRNYIFAAGLWFAARKRVNGHVNDLSFITYNPNSGVGWASPAGDLTPGGQFEPLYHSVDYDRTTGQPHTPNITAPWPLWLEPGETARPDSPGRFDFYWGGRHIGTQYSAPAFMPGVTEQFVSRYDDRNLERYEDITQDSAAAIGFPLGLDIQQNVYAWNSGPFKDVVVLEYEIAYMGRDTLYDCAVAQMTDADVGNATNDHAAYLTRRPDLRAAYAWTEPDTNGPYGVLTTAIIEGPNTDRGDYIDNSERRDYKFYGRLGTFRSGRIEVDPMRIDGRYDYITNRAFDLDNGIGDVRAVMATTLFNMRPMSVIHFAVMYGVVASLPSSDSTPSEVETLVQAVTDAYYNKGFVLDVPRAGTAHTARSIAVAPNPARGGTALRFTTAARSSGRLRVADGIGRPVIERELGMLEPGAHVVDLDLAELPAGFYMATVTTADGTSSAALTVMH